MGVCYGDREQKTTRVFRERPPDVALIDASEKKSGSRTHICEWGVEFFSLELSIASADTSGELLRRIAFIKTFRYNVIILPSDLIHIGL
ncbi:hypothetical protein TNIN_224741 [Trichonephila inaurata madagascariensis]|uniref:Uncharacterized protein n=1 Tax=Trichonephila inaurata madagascariensis TaxID=2747483 RepID=A0A8X6YGA7_9ARAC|nr:hypothetical protein TNIN_224741 [Trichonephila inaurata madagascariensis]